MIDLKGKSAIVTGATRGIGLEIAKVLAENGAGVAILDIQLGDESSVKEVSALGVQCKGYACDVSNPETVEAVFKQVLADFGKIDILVNNAGITRDNLMIRMKQEDFDSVLNVNLRSAFICTKAIAQHFMRNRGGRIINMASINGIRTQAGQANYAASKAGIIGLTKSNAMELSARGITVNAIAPGFIKTAMTEKLPPEAIAKYKEAIPLKDLGNPRDVANAVAFLASDEAGYITGQVLGVDGGLGA
ncbi:beta-ketoacyl-ACP reductase [Fibrobacterales bacterium]|nr:beta-ketoacyl-ACP reductase [Fibrobacterales bacterium]